MTAVKGSSCLQNLAHRVFLTRPRDVPSPVLAVLEAGVEGVQQFSLPVLLAEDVSMGPSVPVGDRLPPGGASD